MVTADELAERERGVGEAIGEGVGRLRRGGGSWIIGLLDCWIVGLGDCGCVELACFCGGVPVGVGAFNCPFIPEPPEVHCASEAEHADD